MSESSPIEVKEEPIDTIANEVKSEVKSEPDLENPAIKSGMQDEDPIIIKDEPLDSIKEEDPNHPKIEIKIKEETDDQEYLKKFQREIIKKLISKKKSSPQNEDEEEDGPLGTFKVNKKKYKKQIKEIKKKYFPQLKQSMAKDQTAVNLAKAAIESITGNKLIPNDLCKKFNKFEKFGQSNNSMIQETQETQQKRSSNEESMEMSDIKLVLEKLESALQDHEAEAKRKKEMIDVINGKRLANMEFLEDMTDEFEKDYN